ncbi:tyrosine phosphatase family-domain-containing protein [Mucor mucedo]|uniref:tyrosine phosphatase family-domain-containing protein n=1 Tax=Mucor mucedo TaxID=29922 RepID=UPI00221F8B0A|nr:tyrosine phosphatase family-domain-containing protein [Mucor mucedo]KAI7888308.1 tyrosine phosphatase family-domain-containing protein [Mucor mucedo]
MGQHVSVTIPRWIDIPGVKNFRDIGGWPLKDGSGYIRERTVFRCGHLVDITQQGINTLKRLNVIAAFDFRSDPEIERQGVMPDIDGIKRYPSAMFTQADYSPAALAIRWKGYFEGPYGFPKVYAVILEKGASQYRNIFMHLIQNHSTTTTQSIIVHCTAGKDRTGIFCMLLLGLCGVEDEIIANEYALSNLGYWEPEHELVKKAEMLGVTIDDVRMVMSAP